MPIKPGVIVLDNGPIHVSKATSVALAERAHWLIVEWLPNKGLNSTTSRLSGVTLMLIIWPTRHSPILTSSTGWAIVAALNSKRKRHRLGNQSLL
jgi:hypothetical protein